MPTVSFGQSGNPSTGTFSGPWNVGTAYIYSNVGSYPTGNLSISGTRPVNIDSVSITGAFSATGGVTPVVINSSGTARAGLRWNTAYKLNYTRYINNGLDIRKSWNSDVTSGGGLRGSYVWSTVPRKPGTPTASASTSLERVVTLTWVAPDNGGSPITGYNIYDASNNSIVTTTSGTGTTANITLPSNTLGTNMSFNVAAINVRGTSETSNNSNTVKIDGNPTAPTLNSVSTGTTSSGTLVASWTKPSTDVTGITGYNIDVSSDGSNWSPQIKTTTSATSITLTGLTPNSTRFIRVAARNAFSDRNNQSSPYSSTLSGVVSGPPSPVIDLTAKNTDNETGVPLNAIKLDWKRPSSSGNPSSSSLSYRITWTSNGGGSGTTTVSSSAGAVTTTINNLKIFPYTFAVFAQNQLTTGGESSGVTVSATPSTAQGWDDSLIEDTFRVGVFYSDKVVRTDPQITPESRTYQSLGSLPPGISLTTVSGEGIISGTPTAQGKYSFTIRSLVSDANILDLEFTVYVRPGARKSEDYEPISIFKRFDGNSWVDVGTVENLSGSPVGVKRFNGIAWVSTQIPTL